MITFTLSGQSTEDQKQFRYRVAGVDVISDGNIDYLDYLSRDTEAVGILSELATVDLNCLDIVYDSSGHFTSGDRHVRCLSGNDTNVLQVEGLEEFILTDNGLVSSSIAPDTDIGFFQEVLVGPPLILQLARKGIYCLHASAARVNDKTCAFIGDSGQGKSTLADFSTEHWTRVSDDVSPVSISEIGIAKIHPHFPQLKLSEEEQYPASAPAQLKIDAMFLLNPIKLPQETDQCSIRVLNQTEATLSIVRHTVASKLFPPEMLKKHLNFAAKLVDRVGVYKFTYPMTMNKLPDVRQYLADWISTKT